jgi:hypothetical protein
VPTIQNDKINTRFLMHTRPNNDPDGCHLWTGKGGTSQGDYGVVGYEGRTQTAHRVAHKLFKGPIPDGQVVRHTCDTPRCVNPAHLTLGTPEDNRNDARERMRTVRSDAAFTAAECEFIRATVDDHGWALKRVQYALGGVYLPTVTKGLRLGREARQRTLAAWSLAVLATVRGVQLGPVPADALAC